MSSLIKYYGSKSYMAGIIESYFPLDYDRYIEGFGGGGSVLLKKRPDPIEIYNDLEKNVYSLFKVISDKDMMERLKDRLSITPYSRNLNKEFKELLLTDLSLEDRAYYFFYVNRSSFNGIGGFSTYVNSVRRNMSKSVSDYLSSIDGLLGYNERMARVIVENLDIFDLIKKYDAPGTFFYLDPPYVQSTRKSNQKYNIEFDDSHHEKLVDVCNNIQGKVLISGYDHPIYDKLEGFEKIEFKSPNSGSDATEVLWRNYKRW